uniref:Uncharacterized protein n=1 Tax=Arundo donax TaxID=35708 RepID=A0A0A9G3P7_ARUDO
MNSAINASESSWCTWSCRKLSPNCIRRHAIVGSQPSNPFVKSMYSSCRMIHAAERLTID